jgi:hypothetical protein
MQQLLNLVISLYTFFFFVFPSFGDSDFEWLIPMKKDLATVILLEIGKATPEYIKNHMPKAEDGLIFSFLIFSKAGEEGLFSLSELRDFEVDGISYAEITKNKLSTLIEPQTIVEDIPDFIAKYRPDLKEKINVPDLSEAVVMITAIGGTKLPPEGKCNVIIDVGWGEKTELFSYEFPLSILKTAQTLLIVK